MPSEAERTRISSCLLCLFFILIVAGSCDGWPSSRRRRRRRSPSPDTTAPEFTYCPNRLGNQYTLSPSRTVSWTTPTATDDRGPATVSKTYGSDPRSTFAAGSHYTRYTARDGAGNHATCIVSFTVIVVRCTSLSGPTHGSVSCSKSAYISSNCIYSCSTGYRTSGGSVSRWCYGSGVLGTISGNSLTWSGSIPTCVLIRCTSLSAPIHGSVSCSHSANIGSNCTYSCSTGYRTSWGSVTRSCSTSRSGNYGIWSGSVPACVRISCGALSSLSNGQVSCSDSSYYNSLCSVSCNEGYTLQGSSSRLCGVSGSWSGSNAFCADPVPL